jgi:cobyrinic acid a,c-diamide synthase
MKSQLLIAASHSGAGKTTVTLGLLLALRRKGYSIQPFKCGPDFIDPIHHRTAAGRDSINLDRYMMSDAHIRHLYDHYSANTDVCITEGVMGLFDGAVKSMGSSADLAKRLGLPVILILNAKAMAYTVAPVLYGLKKFDPALHIAGVIFNFVETAGHYRLLQEACEDVRVPALGYLPANKKLKIPSRYLGLDTGDADAAIEAAADHIQRHLDLDLLLAATRADNEPAGRVDNDPAARQTTANPATAEADHPATSGRRTVLVARDAAFHFLYPENIRRLQQWGDIHYFSPLESTQLPVAADLIYLPGGYPELYLSRLAGNVSLLEQLRVYAAAGGRIIAECGGMMYLGRSIADETGNAYPMAGILDIATGMQRKKLSLGYRTVLLPGGKAKGHEFHYSQFEGQGHDALIPREAYNASGHRVDVPFFYTPTLMASYMHLYWGEEMGFIENWLKGKT